MKFNMHTINTSLPVFNYRDLLKDEVIILHKSINLKTANKIILTHIKFR